MWRLLVFLLILADHSHCSCPTGFYLVRDGECRGLYATMLLANNAATNKAITKCNEIQGNPVIIHNDEQQSYWTNIDKTSNYVILGLVCNVITMQWEWADGSQVDYKPPSYMPSLDGPCITGCQWMNGKDNMWREACDDHQETFDIYCTKQLPPLPVPHDNDCNSFEDDSDDGVCYQVGTAAESWNDAQVVCRKLGANLASIHNDNENSFVRRLAVSQGAVHGLFLGSSISGKDNQFGWIDGSAWDYSNFYPDFPKTGFGDCLAMDTSNSSGPWMNTDCFGKLPVACVRPQNGAEPTCSTETWAEGALITSPGFPYTAHTACDFYLKAEEAKKVQLEIILLQANSCCDSLTVYDGYLGGYVLATLTGEAQNANFTTSSSNIMKVSWQPTSGVNVLGLAMTFRGV